MKRRIIAMGIVSALLSACTAGGEDAARSEDAPEASAWVRPPQIDGAVREGAILVVRGAAGPDARVVLRGADGAAVAVGADKAGRFELRMPAPAGDLRLTPEVQVGEDAAASPETLVVIKGGPIVLIAAGEPTVRLDGRGALDAVDSDGQATVVSGRATGEPPAVTGGGQRVQVLAGRDGDWRATRPGADAAFIVVEGQGFDFPGVGAQSDFTPVRAGEGWRLTWPTGPSGRQTTWLPDRVR
jgi:hypothetical protein